MKRGMWNGPTERGMWSRSIERVVWNGPMEKGRVKYVGNITRRKQHASINGGTLNTPSAQQGGLGMYAGHAPQGDIARGRG